MGSITETQSDEYIKNNGNISPPIVEHIQKKLSTMTLPICIT